MTDLVALIQALVWPAVLVFALRRFGAPIHALLQSVAEGRTSVKASLSGVEVTQIVQSAANAAVASAAQAKDAPPAEQAAITRDIVRAAQTSFVNAGRLATRRILWVDDNRQNNALLAQSFRDLGIIVEDAASTEAALRLLATEPPVVVITDMSRPPDDEAGLTLLAKMRAAGHAMPVMVYASHWAREHRGQEAQYGLTLITDRPNEIYTRTLQLLLDRG